MTQKPPRPIGITILGIIQVLIGVLGFLVSLLILSVSALLSAIPVIGGLASSVGLIIGGVFLFFTLIWLATGVGFLHGRGWAWDLGMIFTILSILGAAYVAYTGVTQAIYALGFWIIMIIYLTRHNVKIFFGKGIAAVSYMPAMNTQMTLRYAPAQSQTQYVPPAQPSIQYTPGAAPAQTPVEATATAKCRSCGMPLVPGNSFCTNCGAKQ